MTEQNSGYQILLEYIHFNNFNLVSICEPYDVIGNGLIDVKNFQYVLLNQTLFIFDKKDVANILNEAPLTENYVKYREYYLHLKVFFGKKVLT